MKWIAAMFGRKGDALPATKRGKRIGAESIQLVARTPGQPSVHGRSVYVACTAIIDAAAYEFDFIHQNGTLDATGRQDRPCWSWVEVRGPHRSRTSILVKAEFAADEPFRWLNEAPILKPRGVRQALSRWFQQPEVRAAWGKSFREADRFRTVLIEEGRKRI